MKYIIKNVNILDGSLNMKVLKNRYILIEDNIIKQISDSLINDKCKLIDGSGLYITPGLINLHCHLPAGGKVNKKVTDRSKLINFVKTTKLGNFIGKKIVEGNIKQALYNGITTERAVGGVGTIDTQVRDLINKGKMTGCRLYVSNEAICTPEGHMEGSVAVRVTSKEEAIKAVKERIEQNVNLIKIMITGGVLDCKVVGHPGDLKMDAELVKAIVEVSHSYGLKVAAHVEGPEGMEIAIKNGVDTIEHGFMTDPKYLDEFIARKGVLVATLSPALPFIYIDPREIGYDNKSTINSKALLDGDIELFKYMLSHKGIIGLGTDTGCPLVTHYNGWKEMEFYSRFVDGVDNNFALHSMTEINASILGEDKLGLIKEGNIADLVLLKDNPLEKIDTFTHPVMVIKDGKIYKKQPKKDKVVEEKLAKMVSNLPIKQVN